MGVPFWGTKTVLVGALAFAAVFEIVTCFFRFYLKKKSTQNTGFIGRCTCGLRIHHGYVGVALVLARNCFPPVALPIAGDWQQLVAIIGWGCILSDGIHHFWILWPITGFHDFDLKYPGDFFPWLAKLEDNLRYSVIFAYFGIVATGILLATFILVPR